MKVLDLCLPTKGSLSKDLNGDEQISTTARADGHGVLFDVDNDGYAEETDWIGPREGILVLDRNGDGQINVATDLFNDYGVHSSSRGLSVLNEINADSGYYGTLDANDPVFGNLLVNELNHHQNRSCLHSNLLSYSTKTYLKRSRACSKQASTKAGSRQEAKKRALFESKSCQSSLFMGVSSYEIKSNSEISIGVQ